MSSFLANNYIAVDPERSHISVPAIIAKARLDADEIDAPLGGELTIIVYANGTLVAQLERAYDSEGNEYRDVAAVFEPRRDPAYYFSDQSNLAPDEDITTWSRALFPVVIEGLQLGLGRLYRGEEMP